MQLLAIVFRHFRLAFSAILLLNLLSAALGVAVIAFINTRLIDHPEPSLWLLPQFLLLILVLMAVTLASQWTLTRLGHHFVYDFRGQLVKRILDTSVLQLDRLGSPKLIASLSSDIRAITLAFVRLPELFQGVVLTLAASAYLFYLSPPLLLAAAAWIALTIITGSWLVARVYRHLEAVRHSEDRLFQDFETLVLGRKELRLNRHRAHRHYSDDYDNNARDYRDHVISADTFHLSAVNWSNIMMLAAIGWVFFLANSLGWANTTVAATFSLTLLYLRTPLLQAVGAFPTLLSAQVAFNKIDSLTLAEYRESFDLDARSKTDWQRIEFDQVRFDYSADTSAENNSRSFTVGPLNLHIERGETLFIIGGNGSGKSTLAMLITGLYQPAAGTIRLDDEVIDDSNRAAYRHHFASVFTDFHLFHRLTGKDDAAADEAQVEEWLRRLEIDHKVTLNNHRFDHLKLSQGQKKRLALMLALAEQRSVLLLDEWAADQDPQFRRTFYRDILPQLKREGITVIAISHDNQYFDQADRLIRMQHGQAEELTGRQRDDAHQDVIREL
ncbi:multidrug ABC transporter permease/ATP-binding protein [Saccharospirillum sp. HFRX-1]|uniref:multidrug ABC transporter permease/ATP-binding protein n=1 Tax=unclassified Saccharospirillum TaxID=2633430 RepID=UPI00371A2F7F